MTGFDYTTAETETSVQVNKLNLLVKLELHQVCPSANQNNNLKVIASWEDRCLHAWNWFKCGDSKTAGIQSDSWQTVLNEQSKCDSFCDFYGHTYFRNVCHLSINISFIVIKQVSQSLVDVSPG